MLLVILQCVILLPFTFASIDTTCLPREEVDTLKEIGRTLGKDWNFELDPCVDWEIIKNKEYENNLTCSLEPICHVVSISLKAQSLPGTLPPELVNLRYLQNLDLTRNYLSGTIPPQWSSMEQIVNISLLVNRLTGSIPKELGNISTLKSFSVEDNMMSGAIHADLGKLTGIERLFLNSNFFTGILPESFANLINLKEFRIGSNNFSGKIPDFIGNWTSLTSLRIMASGLEGPIPPSITLLTNLTDLRISDLRGPDALCPLFKTTPFKDLIMRNCNLIGELPKSAVASKLLDFSFNKLNGSIPPEFSELTDTDYIYLSGNFLSGPVPEWMTTLGDNIDLSYNNFTFESLRDSSCLTRQTNMFSSFSMDKTARRVSCLGSSLCQTNFTSLYINCGGGKVKNGETEYDSDIEPGGASYFSAVENRWGFSNTGNFLDDNNRDSYTTQVSRDLLNASDLYTSARKSALSLTYYGFCMHNGSYNVSLHFAEIDFTDDATYSSLGRRLFDIYIQGVLREKDFDISAKAGGARKPVVMNYTVDVTSSLEIRLYWAGKGTLNVPMRGTYGPLISAISVNPNFYVPKPREKDNSVSNGIVVGVVVGAVSFIILILALLWWFGYLRHKDTIDLHGIELNGLELNTGSFTLKQIKIATNNFDFDNKIGEGGFGSVYKGVLPNGTLIAVKQLSSKSKQGNREFLNELGMISALQHPHLVKLHGCCIEGNQLLLAYEYMENNSLARALFGPKQWQLELDWPTRYRICIQIARGLAFLHDESRLKIVHRDIKATNVLLDKDLNAKISDFGLAKLDDEENTHISTRVAGTYGYMAPEYAMRGYLTDKADVYSYGIVLLEIVSGVANIADRAKENQFVLLDRAIALKATGSLMDLVDPKLGSKYDIQEVMVVINLAILCTTISPTGRPTMSSVVSMLEGRIVPETFIAEQSVSMSQTVRDKLMKQLEIKTENQMTETSFAYTDSSTSAVDLYPVDGFSEYLQRRDSDAKKLLS